MSGRSRRKVTAEYSGSDSVDPAKPSVFERLGAGAMRRGHDEPEPGQRCRYWLKTGHCPFGQTCRYKHVRREKSPEDLRWQVPRKRKGRRSGENSATEDEKEHSRDRSRGRKDKDVKMKSAVSKPSVADSDNADSDPWLASGTSELEYDTTLLIKQRQRLQQELSRLEDDDGCGSAKEASDIAAEKQMESSSTPMAGDYGSRYPEHSASQDSSSKKKKEKKRRKKNKGPRTPSPTDDRMAKEDNRSQMLDERSRGRKQNRGHASRSRSPIADRHASRSGSSQSPSPQISKKRLGGYRDDDHMKSPVAVQVSRSTSNQRRGDGGRSAERKSSRKSGGNRDVPSPRQSSPPRQQEQRERSLSETRDSAVHRRHASHPNRQQSRSSPRQKKHDLSDVSSSEVSSSSDGSSSSGSSSSSDSSSESDDTSLEEPTSKKKEKHRQHDDKARTGRRASKGDKDRGKNDDRSTSRQGSRDDSGRKQRDDRKGNAGRDQWSPGRSDVRQGDMGRADHRGRREEREAVDQRNTRDRRDSRDRGDQRGDERYRTDQRNDQRSDSRDTRNQGDAAEPRDNRGQRDHKFPRSQGDSRDTRDSRDQRGVPRDSRDQRDDRAPRDQYGRNRMGDPADMWLDNPVDAPMIPPRIPADDRMLPQHFPDDRSLRALPAVLRQDLMYRDDRFDRVEPGLRRGFEQFNEHELYRQQHPFPEPADNRFPPLLPPPPEILLDRYGRERVPLQKLIPSRDMPPDHHDNMHRRRNYPNVFQGHGPSPPPPPMLNFLQNPADEYRDSGNKKRMSRHQWDEPLSHDMMLAGNDISPRRMDEMLCRSPAPPHAKRRCGTDSPGGRDWDWGRRGGGEEKGHGSRAGDERRSGGGGDRGDRWRRGRHEGDDDQRSSVHGNKNEHGHGESSSGGDGRRKPAMSPPSQPSKDVPSVTEDGSKKRNRSLSQAKDESASTNRRGGSPAGKRQDKEKDKTQTEANESIGKDGTSADEKKTTAGSQDGQVQKDDHTQSPAPPQPASAPRSPASSRHSDSRHRRDKTAEPEPLAAPRVTTSYGCVVPAEFELEFQREFEREQRLCEREFQARGLAALDWLDSRSEGGKEGDKGGKEVEKGEEKGERGGEKGGRDGDKGGREGERSGRQRDEGQRWQRSRRDSPQRNSERDKCRGSSERKDSPKPPQPLPPSQQKAPDRTTTTSQAAVPTGSRLGDKEVDSKLPANGKEPVDEDKATPAAPLPAARGAPLQGEGSGYDDISDDDLDNLIGKVDDHEEKMDTGDDPVANKDGTVDINWSSLSPRQEPVEPVGASSYRKRFTPAAILGRLGVSRSLAGDTLCRKVEQLCQQNSDSVTADSSLNPPPTNTPAFSLLHGVASLHASALVHARHRAGLVCDVGPYRRALCARRDIDIRRQLCKLDKERDTAGQFAIVPAVDQDIYKQSMQLLNPNQGNRLMTSVVIVNCP